MIFSQDWSLKTGFCPITISAFGLSASFIKQSFTDIFCSIRFTSISSYCFALSVNFSFTTFSNFSQSLTYFKTAFSCERSQS